MLRMFKTLHSYVCRLDMGADGIYVGGGVNPQNGAAAAASIGAATAAFNPGGGGGADTTERISLNLCVLQFLYFA